MNREIKKNCFFWKIQKEVKGKAIPVQAWTSPEGSRRMRLPDFMTTGT
jgi:hypothetical protein